jgi:hypothetical protein
MRNALWGIALSAAIFAACGGAVDATPSPAPAPSTLGPEAQPLGCDSALLAEGRPCVDVDEGKSCELGNDYRTECNTMLECHEGIWTRTRAPLSDARCPTPPPPPEPRADQNPLCPPADSVEGTPCNTATTCRYTATRVCSCVGDRVDWESGRFKCEEENVGCPTTRPRIGTSCSTRVVPRMCSYGHCTGVGSDSSGSLMMCQEGRWVTGCWD